MLHRSRSQKCGGRDHLTHLGQVLFCACLFPLLSVCLLSCLSFCFSLICLAGCKDCLVLPYKVDHPRRRILNFQERRTQVVLTSYCFFLFLFFMVFFLILFVFHFVVLFHFFFSYFQNLFSFCLLSVLTRSLFSLYSVFIL